MKDPYNKEGISEVNTQEILNFEEKINDKLEKLYSNLNPWQVTQVARHEDRPKAKIFIENLFEDFISLSGDRLYGEDNSVIVGFAKFKKISISHWSRKRRKSRGKIRTKLWNDETRRL